MVPSKVSEGPILSLFPGKKIAALCATMGLDARSASTRGLREFVSIQAPPGSFVWIQFELAVCGFALDKVLIHSGLDIALVSNLHLYSTPWGKNKKSTGLPMFDQSEVIICAISAGTESFEQSRCVLEFFSPREEQVQRRALLKRRSGDGRKWFRVADKL